MTSAAMTTTPGRGPNTPPARFVDLTDTSSAISLVIADPPCIEPNT
jgi:hypothetical protein